jgi:hypothetical protein
MNDNGQVQQLNKALIDYFCCPEAFVDFALRGDLCAGQGYFRLGPDLIGYGQSSLGYYAETPAKATCDLLYHVRMEGTTCYIPFNPSAVVDNLRCERYVGDLKNKGRGANPTSVVWKLYYGFRPHLGVSTRKHLQRLWLLGRQKRRFPSWPVDRTVDQILAKLLALSMKAHRVERIPFIWFWPDGHKSCAIMTHDVEESGGIDSCPTLMEIDESFGIKSSFQFIPEKRYSVPPDLLELVRAKGFEVNVHDLNHDGHLYDQREEFLRRAEKINHYSREYGARGFRAGALYRKLDWYDAYEFSYDMSVPNVGHLDPQPGGCCTVMPYFVGQVLELPVTTAQDYTLFNIFSDYSLDLWQRQIKLITENHGLLSFIVHPDYSLEKRARDTYTALLAHLSQLRRQGEVWMALPKEVDHWWRDRARMKIAGGAGGWRIEGPGRERARLAYASLTGDRISYSFDSPVGQAPRARVNTSSEP